MSYTVNGSCIVTPWEPLTSVPPESLEKIAGVLMSMRMDKDENILGPAWGKAGYAVGQDLLNCAAVKREKATKKEVSKANVAKKPEDPQYQAAIRVIDAYTANYKEVFNLEVPIENFGYKIRLAKALLSSKRTEEKIVVLLSDFCQRGTNIKTYPNGRIFGRGRFKDFCDNISLIESQSPAVKQANKTNIPESMRG